MKLDLAISAIHVIANIFWIGAIVAVAVVLVSETGSAKDRGSLGQRIYMRVAVPGFLVSFVFGLWRLMGDSGFYMKSGWFHIKLTMAIVVIALHHIIGSKAKKMAQGTAEDAGKTGLMAAILAICAAAAVFFVSTRFPGG